MTVLRVRSRHEHARYTHEKQAALAAAIFFMKYERCILRGKMLPNTHAHVLMSSILSNAE